MINKRALSLFLMVSLLFATQNINVFAITGNNYSNNIIASVPVDYDNSGIDKPGNDENNGDQSNDDPTNEVDETTKNDSDEPEEIHESTKPAVQSVKEQKLSVEKKQINNNQPLAQDTIQVGVSETYTNIQNALDASNPDSDLTIILTSDVTEVDNIIVPMTLNSLTIKSDDGHIYSISNQCSYIFAQGVKFTFENVTSESGVGLVGDRDRTDGVERDKEINIISNRGLMKLGIISGGGFQDLNSSPQPKIFKGKASVKVRVSGNGKLKGQYIYGANSIQEDYQGDVSLDIVNTTGDVDNCFFDMVYGGTHGVTSRVQYNYLKGNIDLNIDGVRTAEIFCGGYCSDLYGNVKAVIKNCDVSPVNNARGTIIGGGLAVIDNKMAGDIDMTLDNVTCPAVILGGNAKQSPSLPTHTDFSYNIEGDIDAKVINSNISSICGGSFWGNQTNPTAVTTGAVKDVVANGGHMEIDGSVNLEIDDSKVNAVRAGSCAYDKSTEIEYFPVQTSGDVDIKTSNSDIKELVGQLDKTNVASGYVNLKIFEHINKLNSLRGWDNIAMAGTVTVADTGTLLPKLDGTATKLNYINTSGNTWQHGDVLLNYEKTNDSISKEDFVQAWSGGFQLLYNKTSNEKQWLLDGKYNIEFKTDGKGSIQSGSQTIFSGIDHGTDWDDVITIPAVIGKTGYTFDKWSDTFPDTITESKVFTALFKEIIYSIKYDLNGGQQKSNPSKYNVNTKTITLKAPTKKGYTFKGWSGTGLNKMTKKVTISKGSTGNRVYTTNWDKIVEPGSGNTSDPDSNKPGNDKTNGNNKNSSNGTHNNRGNNNASPGTIDNNNVGDHLNDNDVEQDSAKGSTIKETESKDTSKGVNRNDTPSINNQNETWSIINLAIVAAGVLLAAVKGLTSYFSKKDDKYFRKNLYFLTCIIAIISAVILILSEDFSGGMIIYNKFSILIALLFIIQVVITIRVKVNRT